MYFFIYYCAVLMIACYLVGTRDVVENMIIIVISSSLIILMLVAEALPTIGRNSYG